MRSFVKVLDRKLSVEGKLLRVARIDGEKYRFLSDPAPILSELNTSEKAHTPIDIFTFVERLPITAPRYSYPMEWDNFATLQISTFDQWWNQQIGFKARNKAKQAGKKGVVLREVPFDESLVRGIWQIYNETPIRQGKRFPHYGMTIDQIREYAGTFLADSVFIGAFLGNLMIGFIKLTIDETGTQAGLMHIVSMVQHRDTAPTNALIAQAVRSCSERKISYLVYSNFAYGKKQRDSLSDFKERNGFQRVDVPRYYVPLTIKGRIALRLGLHRRLLDYVPEPLMEKFRDYRTSWYSRKLQSSAEAV
jgi:hypothetical protein